LTLCDARRIHLCPVASSPCQGPSCNVASQGLQGGCDPSLPRRIAAVPNHGHSSTLDRYVALVDIHHSHQRFEAFRTTPVGTWPVSRYRHREINSLRAVATIAIRLMQPLALPTRSRGAIGSEAQPHLRQLDYYGGLGIPSLADALVSRGRDTGGRDPGKGVRTRPARRSQRDWRRRSKPTAYTDTGVRVMRLKIVNTSERRNSLGHPCPGPVRRA
jgi:hypothetical protein